MIMMIMMIMIIMITIIIIIVIIVVIGYSVILIIKHSPWEFDLEVGIGIGCLDSKAISMGWFTLLDSQTGTEQ